MVLMVSFAGRRDTDIEDTGHRGWGEGEGGMDRERSTDMCPLPRVNR